MTVQERKRGLRLQLIERIRALPDKEKRRQEDALCRRLATLPGFAQAKTVLLYVTAFPEEIETEPMLLQALDQGKRLLCPRVDRASRTLRLHRVEDVESDLKLSPGGIPEPSADGPEYSADQVDWVLVPGLGFDDRGYRLGRGGGYYDRLLPNLRPDARRWALILEPQWVEELPDEPHDQRLDGVASPGRTFARDVNSPPRSLSEYRWASP